MSVDDALPHLFPHELQALRSVLTHAKTRAQNSGDQTVLDAVHKAFEQVTEQLNKAIKAETKPVDTEKPQQT